MTATLMAAIPAIMAPRMIGFLHGFPVVIEKFLALRYEALRYKQL